jgi:hypothetical protein
MDAPEGVEIKDSPAFSNSASNFALISSDNVRFLVSCIILSEASPWFGNMFTLPQSPAPDPNRLRDSIPFVRIAETAKIVTVLLQYMYPHQHPHPSFNQICSLLTAADKYEMDWLKEILRTLVVSKTFLKEQPLRVYMITQFHRLTPESADACCATLEVDLNSVNVDALLSNLIFANLDRAFIYCKFIRLLQFHQ